MKIQHLCTPFDSDFPVWLHQCARKTRRRCATAALRSAAQLCQQPQRQGGSAIAPLQATAEQWHELKRWLATQDNWTINVEEADFVQAVVKTPLMRFRDDVQLLYNPQTGVIQVRSSSRLGISDMGTNRRRVESLRAHLAAEAAVGAP